MTEEGRGIVEVLGTGTSTGVPTMACSCKVCRSADPRDKRLRVSILLKTETSNVLIDTSPDLRQQFLRAGQPRIDAILYTHHHFDHIGGFDDVRGLNFRARKPIDIYGLPETIDEIERFFAYAFSSRPTNSSSPTVRVHRIDPAKTLTVAGIEFTPIELKHGSMEVLGFKTGNFAYCTDCSVVPANAREKLSGVTNIILDGLRKREHPMHMTIEEAVSTIQDLGIEKGWLTHLAHETSHRDGTMVTPENVEIACDGLKIPVMVTRDK